MSPVAAPYTIPAEVAQFCATHHLASHLETALRLAEEVFAPIQRIEVVLEPDPEVDEEYLIVDVWPRLSPEEAFSRKPRYTREWVRSVPPSVIGKISLILHPL